MTSVYDGDGKRVQSVLTTNIATTTTYEEPFHIGGIQPKGLVGAYQEVFGDERVASINEDDFDSGLAALYAELEKDSIVGVDITITHSEDDYIYRPSASGGIAHFARVLGIDYAKKEVYIDNTNSDKGIKDSVNYSYWTLSFSEFEQVWYNPEVLAANVSYTERGLLDATESVDYWAVFIRK